MAVITTGGSNNVAADLQTYFAEQLLAVAKPVTVFRQFAKLQPIPANSSKTISFTQYPKFALISANLNATEGVPQAEQNLTSPTAITAVADQYGAYVKVSDIAVLTPKHPVVNELIELLGLQAGESIDQIIQGVLVAGTTVQYAGGAASRVALAAGNVMTTTELRKAIKTLRTNAAVPFDISELGTSSKTGLGMGGSGHFVCVVDSSVEADLLADTTFVTAAQYSQVEKLMNGEVGYWQGTYIVRSNNIPAVTSTTTVHTSYLIARGAFAVSDLQALQMITQDPGGVADPLNQYRTLGWKVAFKTVILNQNWLLRIESGSAYN